MIHLPQMPPFSSLKAFLPEQKSIRSPSVVHSFIPLSHRQPSQARELHSTPRSCFSLHLRI
ncbi:hypothetical protein OROGR_001288 [Orobanche gracilis]